MRCLSRIGLDDDGRQCCFITRLSVRIVGKMRFIEPSDLVNYAKILEGT